MFSSMTELEFYLLHFQISARKPELINMWEAKFFEGFKHTQTILI